MLSTQAFGKVLSRFIGSQLADFHRTSCALPQEKLKLLCVRVHRKTKLNGLVILMYDGIRRCAPQRSPSALPVLFSAFLSQQRQLQQRQQSRATIAVVSASAFVTQRSTIVEKWGGYKRPRLRQICRGREGLFNDCRDVVARIGNGSSMIPAVELSSSGRGSK